MEATIRVLIHNFANRFRYSMPLSGFLIIYLLWQQLEILTGCKYFEVHTVTNTKCVGAVHLHHRRRVKTEEKAKVIAFGWGTGLNPALTI